MTSGFMITKRDIPNFWIWLYWLNPTQYALNGVTTLAFYCDMSTPTCENCSLNPATGACPSCACVHVVDQGGLVAWLLMQAGRSLEYEKIGFEMGMLAMFTFIFAIAGIIALRFMRFNKR